jgi:gliding motility-associated-like protein
MRLIFAFLMFWFVSPIALFAQEAKDFTLEEDLFKKNFIVENKGQFAHLNRKERGLTMARVTNGNYLASIDSSGVSFRLGFYEAEEKQFWKREVEDEETPKHLVSQDICFTWLNSQSNSSVGVGKDSSSFYFSYGDKLFNSIGFKRFRIYNYYEKIDLEYKVNNKGEIGYQLIVHPGADLSKVEFNYSGRKVSTKINLAGAIEIEAGAFHLKEYGLRAANVNGVSRKVEYVQTGKNTFGFKLVGEIDEDVIIDPWVSVIKDLPASPNGSVNNNNKAYDLDFDFLGNVYVYGGCNRIIGDQFHIVKYSSTGSVLWVFAGTVPSINWESYGYGAVDISNFICIKATGQLYIGQCDYNTGARIIRLNSAGQYDNFVSIPQNTFQEVWDMIYNCNDDKVWGLGGSLTSNLSYGAIDTSGALSLINFTGSGNFREDVVSGSMNQNAEIFLLMTSANGAPADKIIYKLNPQNTGFTWGTLIQNLNFNEYQNCPYYQYGNCYNALAANTTHVYYTDGKSIYVHNAVTGASVGDKNGYLIDSTYVPLFQGGIYVDECDNILVGGINKVHQYHFDSITGMKLKKVYAIGSFHEARHIYDVRYNPGNGVFYACGDSVLCAIKANLVCNSKLIQCKIDQNCDQNFVQATIIGGVSGVEFQFIWTDTLGNNEVRNVRHFAPNDTLYNLQRGHTYSVLVYQVSNCYSATTIQNFTINCLPPDTPVVIEGDWDIPNAFTPNADGQNDYFKVAYRKHPFINPVLKIYNRYGECVYTSQDIDEGWNGAYNGAPCMLGTYAWTFEFENAKHEREVHKGNLELIR